MGQSESVGGSISGIAGTTLRDTWWVSSPGNGSSVWVSGKGQP